MLILLRFNLLCTLLIVLVEKLSAFCIFVRCFFHTHSFGTDDGLETVNVFSTFLLMFKRLAFPDFPITVHVLCI